MKNWNVYALSIATTAAVVYTLCAIFDALFPPYGLLAFLAPASPRPLAGSPRGYATGFVLFTLAGSRSAGSTVRPGDTGVAAKDGVFHRCDIGESQPRRERLVCTRIVFRAQTAECVR